MTAPLLLSDLRAVMESPHNIRAVTLLGHVDNGKATLHDLLVGASGARIQSPPSDLSSEAPNELRIKSTVSPLYFDLPRERLPAPLQSLPRPSFLINLIETLPAQQEDSSSPAVQLADGGVVVVDCVEGLCVNTESNLRGALLCGVKPVLMLNKIDRLILELQQDSESMYETFCRGIQCTNIVISTYADSAVVSPLHPEQGTVVFGSGLQGWGFGLVQFARLYAARFPGVSEERMVQRLWGDNYFDMEQKQWTTCNTTSSGKLLKRGFCQFVLDPILRLSQAAMEDQPELLASMCASLSLSLSADELLLKGKALFRCVMRKFMPLPASLLEAVVVHLPSPVAALPARLPILWGGLPQDECAAAMRACDPNGPLMGLVSRMIPSTDKGRFIACCRIFSGTLRAGEKVRIMGPEYTPGKKEDLFEKPIQRAVLLLGPRMEAVESVPCGNIVGLIGVDQYVLKAATISSSPSCHPFRLPSRKNCAPPVQVSVDVENPADLPKLIRALKLVTQEYFFCCECTTSDAGERLLSATSCLDMVLRDLKDAMQGTPLKISEPIIVFLETVTAPSSQVCLAKSPNKHNRVWMTACPLGESLATAIDQGEVGARDPPSLRARLLADRFGWSEADANKIWAFGPDSSGSNVLVDTTKGLSNLNECKDSLTAAFQWAAKEGVLCESPLRGVRFNLVDLGIFADAIHRGAGQLIPATRRVCAASQLTASPRLLEPVYLCQVQVSQRGLAGVYSCLSERRAVVLSEDPLSPTSPILVVKAYLPVRQAFDLTPDLRARTAGQAFPQCVLDHWQLVEGDPLEVGSAAHALVTEIRRRKGLKPDIPALDCFLDKL